MWYNIALARVTANSSAAVSMNMAELQVAWTLQESATF